MEKNEKEIFGKIVRVLRASNFLTLEAAAARIKLSTSSYFKYEASYFAPSKYNKQIKIAKAFQIPEELFNGLWNLAENLKEKLNKKDENAELITLQILAYRVLNHYLKQANIPEDLMGTNALNPDTPPTATDNKFNRIMVVLERMNFINTTTLANKADICTHTIGYIKLNKTNQTEETLTKIAVALGLTYSILTQLRELEKKLEEHLEKRTDIEKEKKELLILQALSHALLDYYYRQASTNNNYLKNLYTRKK